MATGGTISGATTVRHQPVRAHDALTRAFTASLAQVGEHAIPAAPEEIVIAAPILREVVLSARIGDGVDIPDDPPPTEDSEFAILLEDGEAFLLEDGDSLIEEGA